MYYFIFFLLDLTATDGSCQIILYALSGIKDLFYQDSQLSDNK